MIPIDLVGTIAATLTTSSFIPQVIRVIRTKNTKDISLCMYILFMTGVIGWTIYGYLLQRPPIIICNIITLFLSGIILFYKLRDTYNKSTDTTKPAS